MLVEEAEAVRAVVLNLESYGGRPWRSPRGTNSSTSSPC